MLGQRSVSGRVAALDTRPVRGNTRRRTQSGQYDKHVYWQVASDDFVAYKCLGRLLHVVAYSTVLFNDLLKRHVLVFTE